MSKITRLSAALVALSLCACGDDGDKGPECDRLDSVAGLTLADALSGGPYPVGVREATLSYEGACFGEEGNEPCERTLRTQVRYPATEAGEDAPVADSGPFPLVVYNHGLMSSLLENTELLNLLASRGFVAVAASFPNTSLGSDVTLFDVVNQPADVTFLIDWVLDEVEGSPSPLAGAVDGSEVVVGGLSLGGMTTLLVTYHGELRDPRVTAAFAIAPPTAFFTASFYETTSVPMILVAGSEDAVVAFPENGVQGFAAMPAPAEFMTLEAGSHLGFAEQGVLLGSAATHPDSIACSTLGGAVPSGEDASTWADLGELGGEAYGIDLTADFGEVCGDDELPRAMRPRRQLDLTNASVVSFLEGRVRGDDDYVQFLQVGIPFDGCDAVYQTK